MDTILGGGYSLEDLKEATEAYIEKRTKIWRGACWHRPDTTLYLEWDDETLYQVGEVLSCSKEEAESVLKLLKSAGAHVIFTTYTHEERKMDDDDGEEFDEDGWLINSEDKKTKMSRIKPSGENYRYLGILSGMGLRRQKQIILRDGRSFERIFFPVGDTPIVAEYAASMSKQYERKQIRQIRFMLRLEIYYLIVYCTQCQQQKEAVL